MDPFAFAFKLLWIGIAVMVMGAVFVGASMVVAGRTAARIEAEGQAIGGKESP